MQSKIVQASRPSTDEVEMSWRVQSPFQPSNILYPHQVGSVESCSSWPGSVWRREPSKYWLDSDLNNNENNSNYPAHIHSRDSPLRLSCSSDCSDISNDDVSGLSSSDTEESDSNNNNNDHEEKETQTETEDRNNNINQNKKCGLKESAPININQDSAWKQISSTKSDSPSRERLLDEEGYIRRAASLCLDETGSKRYWQVFYLWPATSSGVLIMPVA
ncbi:hypothetical protein SK128_005125 [Halocaridina rubra]|uniref:Uncharacterized protein n=1 Tax=Halocaridina rubra TaxID=373956 RepID=A0AAN8WR73_HALRR